MPLLFKAVTWGTQPLRKLLVKLNISLCLSLPFDNHTVTSINKLIASVVAKIYKIRTEKLHELSFCPYINARCVK